MASGAVRILDQRERDPRMFQREELFDREGRSLILPETYSLKKIELRDLLDGIELRVKGLIGYLPLTSDIVLNLVPKFPIPNLWRMLEKADTDYDRIFPILRSYQTADTTPPQALLARGFCHYLRPILSVGMARGYFAQEYQGYYRPKAHFGRTVSRFLSRGDELNIASDLYNFSSAIAPNAVVKSACIAFLRVMPQKREWEEDRNLIGEALNALQNVHSSRMLFGDQSLALKVPSWLQENYHGALMIYSMLLGYSKIGFSYEAHGTQMPSFLFSLDSIFESYVRNVFRTAFAPIKIAVLDGNKPQYHGKLFIDNRRYPTKPDLLFRKNKKVICVGEVKYKPAIDENDRYQLISHVLASDCKLGVWISPATNGNRGGLQYVGTVSTGAKFYHYQISLSADIISETQEMIDKISNLLPDII